MIKFTLWLICGLTLTIQPLIAQQDSRKIVDQSIQWVSVNSNIKLSKRFTWMLDGQFRQVGQFDPQQYQARTAVEIKLNGHFSIVPLGYVYTWNYLYGKQPASFQNNEHRIWQQVSYKHGIGRLKLDHRLRLEQRFIQHHSMGTDGEVMDDGYSDHQNRMRYRFSARIPLNNKEIQPHTYFLSVYDEIFMSWGKKITYHRPDQNRIFAGVGYQFDKRFTIQGGLIYQMLIKSNGTKQENNIGTQLMLVYNVDLTKAK